MGVVTADHKVISAIHHIEMHFQQLGCQLLHFEYMWVVTAVDLTQGKFTNLLQMHFQSFVSVCTSGDGRSRLPVSYSPLFYNAQPTKKSIEFTVLYQLPKLSFCKTFRKIQRDVEIKLCKCTPALDKNFASTHVFSKINEDRNTAYDPHSELCESKGKRW
jgi:hypothetical protein